MAFRKLLLPVCAWAVLCGTGPAVTLAGLNLVPNPNFTGTGGVKVGSAGGTVPDQWRTFAVGGGVASTSIVPVAAHELFTGCAATNAVRLSVTAFGGDQGFDHDNTKFPILPGQPYHLEFYARTGNTDGSSQKFKASFPLFDSAGRYLGREPGTQTNLVATSSWKRFVCPTFTDPSATLAHVAFRVLNDGGQNALIVAWPTVGDPPERFTPPSAADLADRPTWLRDERLVGTTYFYWYRWPDLHFFDDYPANTDDALTDHFVSPAAVSMMSKDWHKTQLLDMIEAGIDMLWPVYWAAPGNFDDPAFSLYVKGLVPLQQARDELIAEGRDPPRIGMFYDTTSLLNSIRLQSPADGKADLTTPEGKEIFYQTIRSFWASVHPRHWACTEGRPITVLYASGFAAAYDQSSFDYVYAKFENEFAGVRPFIVREASWSAQTDSAYRWGAALNGVQWGGVTAVGPGYDDSAVPRSPTHYRSRENGDFYRESWEPVIRSAVRFVHIETWSELHEGTEICETVEYGRQYIGLTRQCIDRFRMLRLVAMTPAPGAELITRPQAVVVHFNQRPDPATLGPETFLLIGAGPDGRFGTTDDAAVAGGTVLASGAQATLDLAAADVPEQRYRVVLRTGPAGVRDTRGGPLYGRFTGVFPTGLDDQPADFAAEFLLTHEFAPADLDRDDDVDQADFGIFQNCMSGSYIPQYDDDCRRARLDFDDDVDADDLMILLRCATGPNRPADLNCGR